MPKLPILKATKYEIEKLTKIANKEIKDSISVRAKVILDLLKGKTNQQVATETGFNVCTIGIWRKNFKKNGINGLYDKKRTGRPKVKKTKKNKHISKKPNHISKKPKSKDSAKCISREKELEIYNIVKKVMDRATTCYYPQISICSSGNNKVINCIYISNNQAFIVLEEECMLNQMTLGMLTTEFEEINNEFIDNNVLYMNVNEALNISARMIYNKLLDKISFDTFSFCQSVIDSLHKERKYNIIAYNMNDFNLCNNSNINIINVNNPESLYIFAEAIGKLAGINPSILASSIIRILNSIDSNKVFLWNTGNINYRHVENKLVIKACISNNNGSSTTKNIVVENILPAFSQINYNDIYSFEGSIGNIYDGIFNSMLEVNRDLFVGFCANAAENYIKINEMDRNACTCGLETFTGRYEILVPYEIKKKLHFDERLWLPELLYLTMKQVSKESYRNSAFTINGFLRRKGNDKILYRNLQYKCKRFGQLIKKEIDKWTKNILNESGVDYEKGMIVDETRLKKAIDQTTSTSKLTNDDINVINKYIDNYNSKKVDNSEKINLKIDTSNRRHNIIYNKNNFVALSVDQVGTKKQKKARKCNNSKKTDDQKTNQISVIHLQNGNDVYKIGMDSLEKAMYVALAIIIKFKLLRNKFLLIFTDGATNIFEAAKKVFCCCEYEFLLDWFHVKKRCYELFSMALKALKKNKKNIKKEIRDKFLKMIFVSNIDFALNYLNCIDKSLIKNQDKFDEIYNYVRRKSAFLYCYAIRKGLHVVNSSNRVEKLNDCLVSARCKHKGMSWSPNGLKGIVYLRLLLLSKETNWISEHCLNFTHNMACS